LNKNRRQSAVFFHRVYNTGNIKGNVMNYFYMALSALAGMALPFQVAMNGQIRQILGHPLWGAITNFVVGLLILLLLAAAVRVPMPSADMIAKAPLWTWAGGLIGALFVMSAILAGPKIGSATFFAMIITGQLLASIVLDHFGVLGFPHSPINFWRIAGVAMLIGGAVLVVKN
jgi:bacterial/archaeal transporter family-2 protein